jgi:hypothetical protein
MHLCTSVSEEGGDEESVLSKTPSLLSYILRCVSFVEVDRGCQVALREPIHLCICVSEEEGDGGAPCSEIKRIGVMKVYYKQFIIMNR